MSGWGERLFALLVRLYPREFREQYHGELLAFFRQDREHPKYGSGRLRPLRFWVATIRDLARTAWSHRRLRRRELAARRAERQSTFERWRGDVRGAWRALRSAPAVTVSALVVLTIGIGATTAIFSVVDAVALRGLPFPDDGQLMSIVETELPSGRPTTVAPQNYADWRARQRVFEPLGASTWGPRLTTIDAPIESLTTVRTTASLFGVLQVAPALGRAFNEADERSGAPPVAILSDSVWRRRYQSDPAVIGRTMAVKTGDVRIVGVMPPAFRYPVSVTADLWIPFVPTPAETVRGNSRNYGLSVVGRLKPGVSLVQASEQMGRIRDALAVDHPSWFRDRDVLIRRLQDAVVSAPVRSWMLFLLGAVVAVLLITCLNVANLLVARAAARGPELAVRTALGASRWDLSRALMIESLLLSLLGAGAGLLAALWGVEILRATLPTTLPRLATVAVDLRVVTLAIAAAVGTGLAFGTLPALQVSRPDLMTLAGQGGRSHSGGRASRRIRVGLVIAEVAIAAVLLAGTGLFLSSFVRVASIDLGFDPRRVVSLSGAIAISNLLRPAETPEARADSAAFQSQLPATLGRLRAVPGVVAAAAVNGGGPLGGTWLTLSAQHADRRSEPFSGNDEPSVRAVTPGYLDVLRGQLTRGRWIEDRDVMGAPPVVVLSDEAARRYFGARDPVGQSLLLDGSPFTIVGVVAPMRFLGPEQDVRPEAFVPLLQTALPAFVHILQTARPTAEFLVRTDPDPIALVPALHAAIRAEMPAAVLQQQTLEQQYASLLAQRKFNMVVLVLFGVVAIVVAAAGVYGLVAFLVEQRRREIGIRVALGAVPSSILRMVLSGTTSMIASGLVIGVAAAAGLERLVRAFLFNPQPYDPVVYGGAALALFAAGLAAAVGPARRAARVDPLVALRTE
jgi:putative ABC transport system permease protein